MPRRTEDFWLSSNPDGRPELSWDEYRAIQYGFLTDEHITDRERRWVRVRVRVRVEAGVTVLPPGGCWRTTWTPTP